MQKHIIDLESLDDDEAEATLFAAMFRHLTMNTAAYYMLPSDDLSAVSMVKRLMSVDLSAGQRVTRCEGEGLVRSAVIELCSPKILRFFSILRDVAGCSGVKDLPTFVLLRALHAVEDEPLLCDPPSHFYSFLEVTPHGTRELGLVGAVDVTLPEPFTGGFEALLDLEFYEDPRQRRH